MNSRIDWNHHLWLMVDKRHILIDPIGIWFTCKMSVLCPASVIWQEAVSTSGQQRAAKLTE